MEKPELRQDGDFISSMELGQSSFARDAAVKRNLHPPATVEAAWNVAQCRKQSRGRRSLLEPHGDFRNLTRVSM